MKLVAIASRFGWRAVPLIFGGATALYALLFHAASAETPLEWRGAMSDSERELLMNSEEMKGVTTAYFTLNGRFFRAFFTKNRCNLGGFGCNERPYIVQFAALPGQHPTAAVHLVPLSRVSRFTCSTTRAVSCQ